MLFSYDCDMPLVYAGFLQAYGVDLLREPGMHWWRFKALLDGLPEGTRLSAITQLRATDTRGLPAKESARIERMKALVAVGKDGRKRGIKGEELIEKARRVKREREAGEG